MVGTLSSLKSMTFCRRRNNVGVGTWVAVDSSDVVVYLPVLQFVEHLLGDVLYRRGCGVGPRLDDHEGPLLDDAHLVTMFFGCDAWAGDASFVQVFLGGFEVSTLELGLSSRSPATALAWAGGTGRVVFMAIWAVSPSETFVSHSIWHWMRKKSLGCIYHVWLRIRAFVVTEWGVSYYWKNYLGYSSHNSNAKTLHC